MGFVVEAFPWRLNGAGLDSRYHPVFMPNRVEFMASAEVWDRAIYYWQRTLENKPDDLSVRQRLAKAYNQIGGLPVREQSY